MSIQNISVVELKKAIDNKENVLILDVRMPQEYKEGYIEGAINLPLDTFSNDLVEKTIDKSAKSKPLLVVIQCRSGVRSLMALSKIIQGSDSYDEVKFVNLAGGILDWASAGYPVRS